LNEFKVYLKLQLFYLWNITTCSNVFYIGLDFRWAILLNYVLAFKCCCISRVQQQKLIPVPFNILCTLPWMAQPCGTPSQTGQKPIQPDSALPKVVIMLSSHRPWVWDTESDAISICVLPVLVLCIERCLPSFNIHFCIIIIILDKWKNTPRLQKSIHLKSKNSFEALT